ncbi:MAG TPA: TolC family protein [Isosphaeraceae bacterium]
MAMLRAGRVGMLALAATLVVGHGSRCAGQGQSNSIPSNPPGAPDRLGSVLGPSPGSGDNELGESPGDLGTPLIQSPSRGSGPGALPSSITTTPGNFRPQAPSGITNPAPLPRARQDIPSLLPLALPERPDDEGPPNGLTLDLAIERLVAANLDLKTQAYEIPQAQADVLTAGLRANPILFADAQLVPYGSFNKARPGGPTQYDVSVTLPLDVTRKRNARTVVACRAARVLEAQYQDAVRLQIGNLYTAFVDALAARETARLTASSVDGLRRFKADLIAQARTGGRAAVDINVIEVQLNNAELGLRDARAAAVKAKQELSALLDLPPTRDDTLELRGSLRVLEPPPPPDPELIPIALQWRPDLQAYRLGIGRAEADVKLAHANRYADVYLTYNPFTYQNDLPFGTQSATSWMVAVTAPIPLHNRNQGNIRRARLNVAQTRSGLAALERKVYAEVFRADQEYDATRASLEEMERELLPAARRVLDNARRDYLAGGVALLDYMAAQQNYNDTVRQYRDHLVRHRRSMLDLNTALGRRVLP